MANIIVVVDKNRDSILCGYFGWGGRTLYVAEHYMAELNNHLRGALPLSSRSFEGVICKWADLPAHPWACDSSLEPEPGRLKAQPQSDQWLPNIRGSGAKPPSGFLDDAPLLFSIALWSRPSGARVEGGVGAALQSCFMDASCHVASRDSRATA